MKLKRTLCGDFAVDDIFTMGETSLLWRQSPSLVLPTTTKRKKNRSHVSIICCSNFTGGERFPLWVVGKSAQPSTLCSVNLEALNIQWRSNSKAWVNIEVIKDWLRAFYKWIGTRRVLLLIDSGKTHMCGIEQMPPPSNICIQWLPPISTSTYQPLDQGIIYQFKCGYNKLWLHFMLSCYEQGNDPGTNVNLYFALSWASQAWFEDLRCDTVFRCFLRTRIQPVQEPLNLHAPIEEKQKLELQQLYELVLQVGGIRGPINLESFLNATSEADDPAESDGFDLAAAIARYSQVPGAAEESEDGAPVRIPTAAEAELAAEKLLLFALHQRHTTFDQIRAIRQLKELARVQKMEQARQYTLDNWLT